jgi:hypothetical protein
MRLLASALQYVEECRQAVDRQAFFYVKKRP